MRSYSWFLLIGLLISCAKPVEEKKTFSEEKTSTPSKETELSSQKREDKKAKSNPVTQIKADPNELKALPDATLVDITKYSDEFTLNIKYATSDNFLKTAVYDCAACYVRAPVAVALIKANNKLMELGYRLQFFDCYRPHSVQKKMWEIFPKPGYVANPRGGSIHNKGAAVDLTITTLEGLPIDMGSAYDHFGWESHHAYANLTDEVKQHRTLLKETMLAFDFKTIRTEWWHYNYVGGRRYPISDFKWNCTEDEE
ncbi:M15 family metallopeptidase [Aquimarina sp. 2-A2]|uniref:M15 family metallopeptidase n=1 Tax=Aquimarina sp. 2-A2 TaxID=3382644 RepID=UPI00387F0335